MFSVTLDEARSVCNEHNIAAPPVDIDGIREPVSGSLIYGNNIISGAVVPAGDIHQPIAEAFQVSHEVVTRCLYWKVWTEYNRYGGSMA